MKKQSGFTLIELMIVVAIVAILAAIAMPAYKSYTARSKFTEVTSGASALKSQVELCYLDLSALTTCSNGVSGAGWTIGDATDYATKYINDIVVSGGTITATASSGEGLGSYQYTLTPTSSATGSGTLEWTASGSCKAQGYC